jgi:hypothetical protein
LTEKHGSRYSEKTKENNYYPKKEESITGYHKRMGSDLSQSSAISIAKHNINYILAKNKAGLNRSSTMKTSLNSSVSWKKLTKVNKNYAKLNN